MALNIDKDLVANSINTKLKSNTKQLDLTLNLVNSSVKSKFQNKVTEFNNKPSTILKDVNTFKTDIDSNLISNIQNVPLPEVDPAVDIIKECFDGLNLDLNKLLGIKLDINLDLPKLDIIDDLGDLIFDSLKGQFDLKLSGYFDPVINTLLDLLEYMQDLIPPGLLDNLFGMNDCIEAIITPAVSAVDLENKLSSVGLDNFGKVNFSHFGLSPTYTDYIKSVEVVKTDYYKSINDNLNIKKKTPDIKKLIGV